MSISAHASHILIPDKEMGKVVAMAMLKSPYQLVISKPYGQWINGYLPMGLSYKDVKEFPTATCLELNCYENESVEVKFFTSDRLAFEFESGIADEAELEDYVLNQAAELWKKDNPELVEKAKEAIRKANETVDEEDEMGGKQDFSEVEKIADFWSLSEDEKKPYLEKVKATDEYKEKVSSDQESVPDPAPLEKIIPDGKNLEELNQLVHATAKRKTGAPEDEATKATVAKYMDGKNHSDEAIEYLKAFANFFEVKGSAWSVESIMEKLSDKVDRRIISLEHLS